MQVDPLVEHRTHPARTAAEVLGAIARIRDAEAKLVAPLLTLHGANDEITEPGGSARLVANAASADKTAKVYDGLVHDLLHEPERDTVVADVVAWLEARAPRRDN